MKRAFALSIILWLLAPCIITAGEIHVYDSSEPPQFLGILIDESGYPVPTAVVVYMPEVDAVTCLQKFSNQGRICINNNVWSYFWYYQENNCAGRPYVSGDGLKADRKIFRSKIDYESLYMISDVFVPINANAMINKEAGGSCIQLDPPEEGPFREVLNIQETDLPFVLPFELPLKYEYVASPKGDYNDDGDVDGNDLSRFVDDFGM